MAKSQKTFNSHDDEVLIVSEYEDITKCPVCNSNHRNIFIKHRNYQLLKCKECDLVYQTPRKKELLLNKQYVDNVSSRSEYYQSTFIIDKITFKERLTNIIKLLNINSQGKKVLDIGCNIGSFLAAASDLGFDPTGVEPNPQAAKECEKRGFKILNSFFDKNILSTESKFDLIHLGDITEHVTTPLELMRTVKECTNDGGFVLISTPNIDSIIAKTFQIKPNEHILYFDKTSLNYLIQHAGLIPVKTFITSRKRDFNSLKYSTSFGNKRNKMILDLVTSLRLGDLATEILKYIAMDELFAIAKRDYVSDPVIVNKM